MQKIPLSKCFVNDEVRSATIRALESGQYILAKECKAFEEELAAHTGAKHCGARFVVDDDRLYASSGPGRESRGDEILVPSHTAFPTMEPLNPLRRRARCSSTWTTPFAWTFDDQIEAAITPRTVGIIPVHLYRSSREPGTAFLPSPKPSTSCG